MDHNRSSMATAFNTLPIELNKEVAHYLTDHKDIANYKAICRAARDAIDGDNFSFWRAKFCEDFDRPKGLTNRDLCKEFKNRWKLLRGFVKKTARFTYGNGVAEKAIINILTKLIVESYISGTLPGDDGQQCRNMQRLEDFVLKSNLLLRGRRPPPLKAGESANDALAAVRLMCTHFLFDQALSSGSWFAIDDAQKAVYAATNDAPLYLGPKKNQVNMPWMLQCFNFFRFYMASPDASQLYDAVQDLDKGQRPTTWKEPLKPGASPLNSCWKGTFAFLEHADLAKFRRYVSVKTEDDIDQIFPDLNVDEGRIQSLYLDFATKSEGLKWPEVFEQKLHSLRDYEQAKERAEPQKKNVPSKSHTADNIRFDGWGEDLDDTFYATGWLNALPNQCGIPGWQRITFMKHFEDDLSHVDRDNLWAYEGVVLPGGRIILGRWWFASEDDIDFNNDYGGPFILWAVEPEPELETPVEEEE